MDYSVPTYPDYGSGGNIEYTIACTDIFVIKDDGKTIGNRLHRHRYDHEFSLRRCIKTGKIFTREYLRFELKSEWYHFTPDGKWY